MSEEKTTTTAMIDALFPRDVYAQVGPKLTVSETLLRLVTRDMRFNDFVREILITIVKVVKCEAGSILELDHRKNQFFFRAAIGSSADRIRDVMIPWGQGIVGHVAESKLPFVVNDVAS